MTYNAQLIHETTPGYANKLEVLRTLAFNDVDPLVVSVARDLWPLGMRHLNQVYVGHKQEKDWDEIWMVRGLLVAVLLKAEG